MYGETQAFLLNMKESEKAAWTRYIQRENEHEEKHIFEIIKKGRLFLVYKIFASIDFPEIDKEWSYQLGSSIYHFLLWKNTLVLIKNIITGLSIQLQPLQWHGFLPEKRPKYQ